MSCFATAAVTMETYMQPNTHITIHNGTWYQAQQCNRVWNNRWSCFWQSLRNTIRSSNCCCFRLGLVCIYNYVLKQQLTLSRMTARASAAPSSLTFQPASRSSKTKCAAVRPDDEMFWNKTVTFSYRRKPNQSTFLCTQCANTSLFIFKRLTCVKPDSATNYWSGTSNLHTWYNENTLSTNQRRN